MLGRFEEARAILGEERTSQTERGGGIVLAGVLGFDSVELELLAGDHAAAVRYGLEGCRLYAELGERSYLSGASALLGQAYYGLGELDEAETWAGRSRELGASDDLLAQMLWRQVQARVLARRGAGDEAERLTRGGGLGRRADRHAPLSGARVRRPEGGPGGRGQTGRRGGSLRAVPSPLRGEGEPRGSSEGAPAARGAACSPDLVRLTR